MIWRIKDPKRQVQKTLNTEQLISGLRRGDVSPESWLKRDDSEPWRPLTTIEAFDGLAEPGATSDQEELCGRKLGFWFAAVAFAFAVGWLLH